MSEKFNTAMYFVEISEGGTNPDPDDRGGFTKYGISQKQYPNLDIGNLTKHTARQIYYNDYWLPTKCESMKEELAVVMFDSCVNCGTPSASKWLQLSLNELGSELKVDGVIGEKTIAAVNANNCLKLVNGILSKRLERYCNLIQKDPAQRKFVVGWMRRVSYLMKYIM